jgi:high-affinity nickel permease
LGGGDNSSSASLSGGEKMKIAIIYLALAVVTIMGFSASFVIGKITIVLAGLGIITYVFGLRHGSMLII